MRIFPSTDEVSAACATLDADSQEDAFEQWLDAMEYDRDEELRPLFLAACAEADEWERDNAMLAKAGL